MFVDTGTWIDKKDKQLQSLWIEVSFFRRKPRERREELQEKRNCLLRDFVLKRTVLLWKKSFSIRKKMKEIRSTNKSLFLSEASFQLIFEVDRRNQIGFAGCVRRQIVDCMLDIRIQGEIIFLLEHPLILFGDQFFVILLFAAMFFDIL